MTQYAEEACWSTHDGGLCDERTIKMRCGRGGEDWALPIMTDGGKVQYLVSCSHDGMAVLEAEDMAALGEDPAFAGFVSECLSAGRLLLSQLS